MKKNAIHPMKRTIQKGHRDRPVQALRFGAFVPLLATLFACTESSSREPGEEEQVGMSEQELKVCDEAGKMDWEIHMDEPFDTFDETRWTKWSNRVPPRTSTCYVPENVVHLPPPVGMIRIDTKPQAVCGGPIPEAPAPPPPIMPYTGGALDSYWKFSTGKYFKAEIRTKVSQEKGIFAAPIWFRPGNLANGPLPVGGEIDIESLGVWSKGGRRAKAQFTLHPDYADTAPFVHDKQAFEHMGDKKAPDYIDDKEGTKFHTYVIEKVPNGITYYVDGEYATGWGCGHKKNHKRPSWYKKGYEDNPEGWSIRIDNKVGGGWAKEPNEKTHWGWDTSLYIDYIKMFRPKTQ